MKLKVYPTQFHGAVSLIGSKSYSHRALIMAACTPGTSTLKGLMESDDLDATRTALQALGAKIEGERVSGPLTHAPSTLDARASGSTLRMLIPQTLRFNTPVTWQGKHRLPQRSLAAYERTFAGQVDFEHPSDAWLPLTVKGPLQSGLYELDPRESSQCVSGLLMALPLCDGPSVIRLTHPLVSQPYVDMTLKMCALFGFPWTIEKDGFRWEGIAHPHPQTLTIEGDYSHSVFFLAGALMGGDLRLDNLPLESAQGDRKVIDWLNAVGASIVFENTAWQVKTQSIRPLSIDLHDYPDTAPMLMALAGLTPGRHRFSGIHRLFDKESNRLAALQETLEAWGIRTGVEDDTVWIDGQASFEASQPLKTYHDHRLAMSYLMCAPKARAPYMVEGVECIDKSYPHFLDVYRAIGGRFDVLEGDVV